MEEAEFIISGVMVPSARMQGEQQALQLEQQQQQLEQVAEQGEQQEQFGAEGEVPPEEGGEEGHEGTAPGQGRAAAHAQGAAGAGDKDGGHRPVSATHARPGSG